LEYKGNAAVVTIKLTESLLTSLPANFKDLTERRLSWLTPSTGIRSSMTSGGTSSVLRSKKAKRFQRDEAMVKLLLYQQEIPIERRKIPV
jgi:hypothetical protein